MSTYSWYKKLKKPSFAPPSWLFGVVWTCLYPIILLSFGYVFFQGISGEIPFILLIPFILNLIFNFAFTPIQFKLKSNGLAALDISLVIVSLVWAIIVIFPLHPVVAYLQIPYLLWGTFATVLQFSITYLNKKKV